MIASRSPSVWALGLFGATACITPADEFPFPDGLCESMLSADPTPCDSDGCVTVVCLSGVSDNLPWCWTSSTDISPRTIVSVDALRSAEARCEGGRGWGWDEKQFEAEECDTGGAITAVSCEKLGVPE